MKQIKIKGGQELTGTIRISVLFLNLLPKVETSTILVDLPLPLVFATIQTETVSFGFNGPGTFHEESPALYSGLASGKIRLWSQGKLSSISIGLGT